MSLEKVCEVDALKAGQALRAEISDEQGKRIPIAVVRDEEGGWHAIDALCTHGDIALDEGEIEGCAIECWGHGAQFDLNTGQPTLPATEPVKCYQLEIKGQAVYVSACSRSKGNE